MILTKPLIHRDYAQRDSAWEGAANYEKEERPMRPVRKLVVKGAVDAVFFRAPTAHLVVAGENQEAIRHLETRFEGDKLVIEQKGVAISAAGGSINVSGSGNFVADGTMQFNGPVGQIVMGPGRCIVGIALPERRTSESRAAAT